MKRTSNGLPKPVPFVRGFKPPSEEEAREAVFGDSEEPSEALRKWLTNDRGLFQPVPAPKRIDDWLAQYSETPQTFGDYLRETPWLDPLALPGATVQEVFPHRGKVYLAQLGDLGDGDPDLRLLSRFAQTYLGLPVESLGTFDLREEDSRMLLKAPGTPPKNTRASSRAKVVKHRGRRKDFPE